MNSAQVEAFERFEHAEYMARIEAAEQREAREDEQLKDAAEYMVNSFLRTPKGRTENYTTYTVEQSLDETMFCSNEPHSLAMLDLARRAAIGENVQTLARELLGKLATEWVRGNRETYLRG